MSESAITETGRIPAEQETPGMPALPRPGPFLSPEELVSSLKARGVRFDLCSEQDAANYLDAANNYLRAASYRKVFDRQTEGPRAGDYVNLDFAHLADLSSIDRCLRETLFLAAADVEHFAKLHVLNRAKAQNEDGYGIVADYIASASHNDRNRLIGGLRARTREEAHDEYAGDLQPPHSPGRRTPLGPQKVLRERKNPAAKRKASGHPAATRGRKRTPLRKARRNHLVFRLHMEAG